MCRAQDSALEHRCEGNTYGMPLVEVIHEMTQCELYESHKHKPESFLCTNTVSNEAIMQEKCDKITPTVREAFAYLLVFNHAQDSALGAPLRGKHIWNSS